MKTALNCQPCGGPMSLMASLVLVPGPRCRSSSRTTDSRTRTKDEDEHEESRAERGGRLKAGLHTPFLAALLLLSLTPAHAQWTTQTLTLQPGWNAVFLEIQPEPSECDAIFAGMDVETVWAWNRRFSSVQFIQDPSTLVPGQPDWLTWLPPAHPARATMNLFILEGGRAYLIKRPNNAAVATWTILGQPVVRRIDWQSDSLNFVGFCVSAQNPPTFDSFFAGAAAHAGQPIYQLDAAGRWQKVANLTTTTLENGRAYWIGCKGPSTFAGPVALQLEQSTGVEFRRTLVEQTVRLRNASSTVRTFSVRTLPSANPPGAEAPKAGEVPLAYFQADFAAQKVGWVPLAGTLEKRDLKPGEEWLVRLEVRRTEMAANTDPTSTYQTLLEVTDDFGARLLLPVTAQGPQSAAAPASPAGANPSQSPPPPHKHAGLWLGSATINKVSQPASISDPTTPQPTAAEFQFRLIVHVDASGQARLLQRVLQMWKDGTTKPDPDDPTKQIVDVPGRFVLLTDETLLPNFVGAALRDGVPVGRRVSSAAFSFKSPISFSGAGDFGANTMSCAIALPYDDPLNPFLHRYHPDHNNLDERFSQKRAAGVESFTVMRSVEFQFSTEPPDGSIVAGWGDRQLGGVYRETITGLHNRALSIQGSFQLEKASTVAVLNDQN